MNSDQLPFFINAPLDKPFCLPRLVVVWNTTNSDQLPFVEGVHVIESAEVDKTHNF